MIKSDFLDIMYKGLSEMPVCINNYYGDPTLQWKNTLDKIRSLKDHHGTVAFITRGLITDKMADELLGLLPKNFLVLVSISNLPTEIEPISQTDRYLTLKNLNDRGIKNLACVRPLIPSLNGDRSSIEQMFKCISEVGTKNVVVSGFRGDDALVSKMNLTDKLIKLVFKNQSYDQRNDGSY